MREPARGSDPGLSADAADPFRVSAEPSFAALRFGTTSDAQDWADEFISEISASLDRVRNAPESYPAWPGTRAEGPLIRKAIIQRFAYVIAFEEHDRDATLSQADADRAQSRGSR